MPREYPLAFFEMSFLLPHFLKEGRGKLAMYFTRVYNPVWTNPDGMSWIEMLTDEAKIERHACLTPIWSETAWFADYVLPMGHASERHDLMSQETHAARWIGFRQPVLRVALEKTGARFDLIPVVNSLFGASVTTAGLLPGTALHAALAGRRDLDLALLPAYRNAGLGTLLLGKLQAEARQSKKPLRLQVIRFNRAVNLFERLGFVRSSETGTHFQMEWHPRG